ncbi:MAG: glycosyltransferase family 1 protein, partial [Roseomonas sp.]|nr:glycosyltransferase family 1 protein [Roseomonas sp.]
MTGAIHLLVPAPFSAISGGYIYDRRMVEGLSALGQEVRVVELAGRHPFPDETATEAARASLAAMPAGARMV